MVVKKIPDNVNIAFFDIVLKLWEIAVFVKWCNISLAII